MRDTVRQVIGAIVTVHWPQFDGLGALRCTIGVAVPLLAGLGLDQPLVGVFGAAGAVGVGFGSFQGAYRGRAALMLLAALVMAFSVLVGSLAGHSTAATITVATLWAFSGGVVVSLGQGASFVGLQSIVAVLIAGGYPADLGGAINRAALVFAGGLVQTFLVIGIWPLRRFAVERRSLAAAFRSLAAYALTISARDVLPPEPHTFAGTASPLVDPQPFARSGEVFAFQALLDEAERIRASLAALAVHYQRFEYRNGADESVLVNLLAAALAEIAAALEQGRAPREPPGFSDSLPGCLERLPSRSAVEPLLGQIRAAWRMAGALTAEAAHLAPRGSDLARRRKRPPVRDALITLRANLTTRSTAFRHALRLAAIVGLAAAGARIWELPRGYWLPLTIALVLKPDFHDTFAFSIGRVAGTVLGAAGATAIALLLAPGPTALVILVLGFVWGAYGFRVANYGAFSVCITGYVVFLMTLAGIPGLTAATDRILYTVVAGALALCAYIAWPTWTATEARPALAAMLEAQSGYIRTLLEAYAVSSEPDLKRLGELRAAARLSRSNAEAVVERMVIEPRSEGRMRSSTAAGIVGATRRNALAALSLHARLEREVPVGIPAIREIASQLASGLLALASAVRHGVAPLLLRSSQQTALAQNTATDDAAIDEIDLIADSIDTIAGLLAKDGERAEPAV